MRTATKRPMTAMRPEPFTAPAPPDLAQSQAERLPPCSSSSSGETDEEPPYEGIYLRLVLGVGGVDAGHESDPRVFERLVLAPVGRPLPVVGGPVHLDGRVDGDV